MKHDAAARFLYAHLVRTTKPVCFASRNCTSALAGDPIVYISKEEVLHWSFTVSNSFTCSSLSFGVLHTANTD